MSRNELTKIGIYLVIILIILRFAITPLNSQIKEKNELLSQVAQSYSLKQEIYERKVAEAEKAKKAPEATKYVYAKRFSYNAIRNTVLNWLLDEAEKKGLSIVNFELPEIKKGKVLSEMNVTIRLKGKIKSVLDFVDMIEQTDKLLLVKNLDISRTGQEYNITLGVAFFRSEI